MISMEVKNNLTEGHLQSQKKLFHPLKHLQGVNAWGQEELKKQLVKLELLWGWIMDNQLASLQRHKHL